MITFDSLFESPWYLLLLLVLPFVWWLGLRSLSGFGVIRKLVVLGVRTAVVVLIVLALAEVQWPRISNKLSVIYLLDQSESIPAKQRRAMFDYVAQEAAVHRDEGRGDRAGVIVFGREAAVESAPLEGPLSWLSAFDSLGMVRTDATNLAAALKLAQATFPEDTACRVVIVSDGNQNIGDARGTARLLAESGVGIDVVPVHLTARSEITVEKIAIPSNVQRGQTFDARVVLETRTNEDSGEKRVPGRLRVSRVVNGEEGPPLSDSPVVLEPGKQVFRFPHMIDEPGAYTYKARFTPDRPADDLMLQNNEATAFTHVRGRGRVLLIENREQRGDFDRLATALRKRNLEVDLRDTDDLFSSLAELQAYDVVVLANVPRTSGDGQRGSIFSDEQITMLVRNTEQLGCGLVMLGGPESFGAGGWTGTELEKAMPVDFQIKNAKVVPIGALMLVLDRSGSMDGEKLALSQHAAAAAIKVLSPKDYIGVVAFDSAAQTVVPLRRVEDNTTAVRLIRQLGSGGGTDMYPGMQEGYAALMRSPASVKHMVVLTDGQTPDADFDLLARQMRSDKITVSTVAVGSDAAVPLLSRIAHEGGGKFYHVRDPRAIPRIFIQEAMRVARPLVFEREQGFTPNVDAPHEMLEGIDAPLPPITGYVLTTLKENPLVDAPIVSPLPTERRNATLLAGWNYGLGRTAVFTSDAGNRWASDWTGWTNYDKFFAQIVRWTMRPNVENGNFTAAVDVREGKVRLIVTALDTDDEFLNFLNLTAAVVDPEMQSQAVVMRQTAPGRYVGEFDATLPGSYFATIAPGGGRAPILLGVNVPYSAEFRELESNLALLESLAALEPEGGRPGEVIDVAWQSLDADKDAELEIDTFRRTLMRAASYDALWPLLMVIAACVFFADVFVRRVTIDFGWLAAALAPLARFVLRREAPAPVDERIARLRSRKQEVGQRLDEQRAATRFEPRAETSSSLDNAMSDALRGDGGSAGTGASTQREALSQETAEEDDYTARLLKARDRIRRQHRPK